MVLVSNANLMAGFRGVLVYYILTHLRLVLLKSRNCRRQLSRVILFSIPMSFARTKSCAPKVPVWNGRPTNMEIADPAMLKQE